MQIPLKISQLTTLKMPYRMFSKKVGIWDLIKEAANSFHEKNRDMGYLPKKSVHSSTRLKLIGTWDILKKIL